MYRYENLTYLALVSPQKCVVNNLYNNCIFLQIHFFFILQLSHGIIQVQFPDGSHVSVIPPNQGGGITFTQTTGSSTHFSPQDDLPTVVREKLAQLPQVERQLKQTPLLRTSGHFMQSKQQQSYNGHYAVYERMHERMTTPRSTSSASTTQQHPIKYFR